MPHLTVVPSASGKPPAGYTINPVEQLMTKLPLILERLNVSGFRNAGLLEGAISEVEALPDFLVAKVTRAGTEASQADYTAFVVMVTSSWTHAAGRDLAGYAALLFGDLEYRPRSVYALTEAGRRLRRTYTFLPSIAEILAAVEEVDHHVARAVRAVEELPERLAYARRALAAERTRERLEEEELQQVRARWEAERAAASTPAETTDARQ